MIGLCIYKQNGNAAYWKFHEAVFKGQKDIPNEGFEDKLLAMAKDAGADQAKVKGCFDAGETKALVDATLGEAEAIGVNSTPTFFINGKRLSGAQSLEAFKAHHRPRARQGRQELRLQRGGTRPLADGQSRDGAHSARSLRSAARSRARIVTAESPTPSARLAA